MDLIADLAFPLPFVVISEMLGMPEGGDRAQLREWSGAVVKTFDPINTREETLAAFDAIDNIVAYINETVAWKREHPADDLLTALIAAEDEGDRLSAEELTEQVMLLYIAGHETTVNLIGNGTLALLRHRDQLEALQRDPALDAGAPDELLRYDSPVQMSRRITLTPTADRREDDRAGLTRHDVPRLGQPRRRRSGAPAPIDSTCGAPTLVSTWRSAAASTRCLGAHLARTRRHGSRSERSCAGSRSSSSRPTSSSGTVASCCAASAGFRSQSRADTYDLRS